MVVKVVIPVAAKKGHKDDIVKLVQWKARGGEYVEKGNVILCLETEKASYDFDAEASGFLHILVAEGDKVIVGAVVGLIVETKEEIEELSKVSPEKLTR